MERVSIKRVKEMLEVKSDATVYALMKRDPTFPRGVKRLGKTRWIESDVRAWLDAQDAPTMEENAKRLKDGAIDAR